MNNTQFIAVQLELVVVCYMLVNVSKMLLNLTKMTAKRNGTTERILSQMEVLESEYGFSEHDEGIQDDWSQVKCEAWGRYCVLMMWRDREK